MKKMILKYIGIGFAALIILAFAIYFVFKGSPDGASGRTNPQTPAQDDGVITVDEMPQVGDEIYMRDVTLEKNSITYDSYSCFDIPSSTTYQIYIVHNNLEYDVDLYMDIDYKKKGESDVQRNSIYINNVPANGDACVWTIPGEFVSDEVTFNAQKPEENTYTISNQFGVNVNDNGNGIEAVVTNNSPYNAYYVDACVLFKKGKDIVRFQPVGLYTKSEVISSGASESFTVEAYAAEYDSVEIYFSGYGAL